MKEFDIAFGRNNIDREELKTLIKQKEKNGYYPVKPSEAERYFKIEKEKYRRKQEQEENKRVEKLLTRNGFL